MLSRVNKNLASPLPFSRLNAEGGTLDGTQLQWILDEIPFPEDGYQSLQSHASVCVRDKVGLRVYDKPERTFISDITLLKNQRAESAEFP